MILRRIITLEYIHRSQWGDYSSERWSVKGHMLSSHPLRKLYFHFLSHWMGYDRGDSFPFDFKPNGIPFGSKSKGKMSPRSYPIQYERKWKHSFLRVYSRVMERASMNFAYTHVLRQKLIFCCSFLPGIRIESLWWFHYKCQVNVNGGAIVKTNFGDP